MLPALGTGVGEVGVFRQEAIAGMHSIGPGLNDGAHHRFDVEIAFRGNRRTDSHGLVSLANV